MHFGADTSHVVLKLSRKTRFGSKRTFLLQRPVLQFHYLLRPSNADSEICVVGDQLTVLFDSGIRTGVDIIKALSLGAKGVLIGR